ncbi:MAG: Cna B-type domain-containing protein [Hornefia sp.]|nr:Cna B-type domain-containing protein [Hornefia sp.]
MKIKLKEIVRNTILMKTIFSFLMVVFVLGGCMCFTADNAAFGAQGKPYRQNSRQVYHVWFDGTLGMGKNDSLVQNTIDDHRYTDNRGNVNLPNAGEAGYNNKYELKGWIDTNTGKWYAPGSRAQVSKDTVFYASWMQRNYNLHPNGALLDGITDTGSFIKTNVFDYNELFNIKHGAKLSGNIQGGYSHDETWNGKGADLLFTNWYNFDIKPQHEKSLGFPAELENVKNKFDVAQSNRIFQDIMPSEIKPGNNDGLLNDLFKPETNREMGKNYLGKGNMLFRYIKNDIDPTGKGFKKGYYYYDSDINGTDYNKDNQRFYVYNNKQFIQKQSRRYGGGWDDKEKISGFMPFEQGTVYEKSGQTNYWFGMSTELDFTLPNDVGYKDSQGKFGNQAIGRQDMKFFFSGDDDVWVYVDGKRVLDLGGIHARISGEVNFSTGVITYYNGSSPSSGVKKRDVETLKKFKKGDHNLKIYYLERGSSESNCAIYFNLAPKYTLNIDKYDVSNNTNGPLLPNAEFSVYKDKACTVPVRLWNSEAEYKQGNPPKNVFKTDADGKLRAYGLFAGDSYFIKETKAPAGYPSVSDKIIELKLDATGNATLENNDDNFAQLQNNNGSTTISLRVNNKKKPKTSVEVNKHWYNKDGSLMGQETPESVKVRLYKSTKTTGGGSLGAAVPVNFTTQYFDANYLGAGNGCNEDTGFIKQGDYKYSTVATSGGKLKFRINITQNSTGIYSVTAGGKTLYPVSSGNNTDMNCSIDGEWGNYPPRTAEYVIDPVKSGTDIKVTLIGYIGYKPNTGIPSVAASMEPIQVTSTDPAGQGGTPPDVMPEDAEPVGDVVTLSKQNMWHKKWDDLPATDANGKPYYYYVKEISVDGYSTSYENNGVINGKIEINNIKIPNIIIKKKWLKVDGTEMSSGDRPDISIKAVLIQTDVTTGRIKEFQFDLNKSNNWMKQFNRNSSQLAEEEGKVYKYKVKEISQIEGYDIKYDNNSGISEGEILIKNRQRLYELPHAGGMGTYMFTAVGSAIIALAVMMFIYSRRKNNI